MENASTALKIAGGILIGVLVLSLLVVGYYNLRSYMTAGEKEKNEEQKYDFNKQFSIYVNDIYGSDLLSLVNKAQDYNIKEAGDKSYSRLDIIVTFTSDISTKINGKTYGFSKGRYTTDQIVTTIDNLQKKIDEIGKIKYSGYEVSKLSLMRTNEQRQKINNGEWTDAQSNITNYLSLKSDETTVKSKIFKFVKVQYDNTTGRIKLIEFKL